MWQRPRCQCRRRREMQVQFPGREGPWRRKWHPTPVFFSGKPHGQRRLVGCSPWGHRESVMTKQLSVHTVAQRLQSEAPGHPVSSPGWPPHPCPCQLHQHFRLRLPISRTGSFPVSPCGDRAYQRPRLCRPTALSGLSLWVAMCLL